MHKRAHTHTYAHAHTHAHTHLGGRGAAGGGGGMQHAGGRQQAVGEYCGLCLVGEGSGGVVMESAGVWSAEPLCCGLLGEGLGFGSRKPSCELVGVTERARGCCALVMPVVPGGLCFAAGEGGGKSRIKGTTGLGCCRREKR
eukprot:1088919-Pelagomonas_calceolata.AAC.1